MASILESLTSSLTPDITNRIGSAAGVAPNLVTKGLGVVGPLVLGLAAKSSSQPGGLQNLLKLVPTGLDASPAGFGDFLKGVTDVKASTGLTNGVFGAGVGAISRSLTRTLGFDVSGLLRIGGPLVLAAIAKRMKESKLDDVATGKLLQDESKAFLGRGDDVSRTVQEAIKTGEDAVALREKYTPREWSTARLAPIAAAQVVMMASPSGVPGAVNELSKAADEIQKARGAAVPSSLVGVLFDGEFSREEVQTLKDRQVALGVLKEGIAVVKAKSPTEAKSYGTFLVDVAIRTAEATKEGGFLGFGGTKVSREEQEAIDTIRAAADLR